MPRLRLCGCRARKSHVIACRHLDLRNAVPRVLYKRIHAPPAHVASDGLHATRAFVQDDVAARGFLQVGKLAERNKFAVRIPQRQRPQLAHLRSLAGCQQHRNIEHAVTFVGLPHDFASIGRAHYVQNRQRIESPACDAVLAQPHQNFRHPGRRLQLHFSCPRNRRENSGDLRPGAVHLVEVIAKNIHRHRGSISG